MINYDQVAIPTAIEMQLEFQKRLKFDVPDSFSLTTIAGADISYNKNSDLLYAAIVILSYPQMKLISYSLTTAATAFPYVPGFLGFREVPVLLKAWENIAIKPDVVVFDGQGFLHPRRMGIAAHFGVLTQQATIGCAKSSLYGYYDEPKTTRCNYSSVYEKDSKMHLGYALRTKNGTKPVYVSPGYGLSLKKSLAIMLKCMGNYRIPEPTRIAHEVVNEFRMGKLKEGFHVPMPTLELF